jgi:hypothetical protein
VADIVATLEDTQSRDTYLAVLTTLAQMGAEARPALPALFKHGERLRVFEGAFDADNSRPHHGRMALEALAAIVQGHGYAPSCSSSATMPQAVQPVAPSALVPTVGSVPPPPPSSAN